MADGIATGSSRMENTIRVTDCQRRTCGVPDKKSIRHRSWKMHELIPEILFREKHVITSLTRPWKGESYVHAGVNRTRKMLEQQWSPPMGWIENPDMKNPLQPDNAR